MDTTALLRWVLLLVGVAVVLGIYLLGRGRKGEKEPFEEGQEDALSETDGLHDITPELSDDDLDQLGSQISAMRDEPLHEPVSYAARLDRGDDDEPDADVPHISEPEEGSHTPDPEPAYEPLPRAQKTEVEEEAAQHRASQSPEKIIAVFVTAPPGHVFHGNDLMAAFRDTGLEYGDMRIFHAYREVSGVRKALFSVANMVEPGWFDIDAMDELETPGLALFVRLPGPVDALEMFDTLMETSLALKDTLGGELRDATRSVMSHQTIAHLREEVQDFCRKLRVVAG